MITFLESKRRYERAAVVLIILSVLFLALSLGGGIVNADLSDDNGRKLGGTMFNSVLLISHSLGSAIEPISILMVEACIALAAKVIPDVLGQYTPYLGFMNNTVMSLVIIALFVILKIPKMFGVTRIGGIAVADIENNAMAVFNFALPFLMFFIDDPTAGTKKDLTVKLGACVFAGGASDALAITGKILLCTLLGVYLFLSYYVMRTVMYAGDILVTLFAYVPGLSMLTELFKTGLVIAVVILSITAPWVIIAFYVMTLIVCIVLFRKAYRVTYYFRKIYLHPFFVSGAKKISIAEELAKKYGQMGECRIPAFIGTPFNGYGRFERCYIHLEKGKAILESCGSVLGRKAKTGKEPKAQFVLDQFPGDRYKIRKGLRYIEIYKDDEKAKKKKSIFARHKFCVVISREYSEFYGKLAGIGGFENVNTSESRKKGIVTA